MTIFLFLVLDIQKYFEWGHEFEWIVGARKIFQTYILSKVTGIT